MHVSISMRVWLPRRTDRRCGPAARTRPRAASVQACARACAIGQPRRHVRAPSVGVDRVRLGSQAFRLAFVFNADIGAWTTASVSNMQSVCAAFSATGGAPPQAGHARRVVLASRAVFARRRRRRACVCEDVWPHACAGAHVCRYRCAYERRELCRYVSICMQVYVYVYTYALYIYI